MPTEVLEYIAPLIGFMAFGTFSLIGLRMWLSHRAARSGQIRPAEIERLAAGFEDLKAQVDAMRDENAELHERMDFAERMLARGKAVVEGDVQRLPGAPGSE